MQVSGHGWSPIIPLLYLANLALRIATAIAMVILPLKYLSYRVAKGYNFNFYTTVYFNKNNHYKILSLLSIFYLLISLDFLSHGSLVKVSLTDRALFFTEKAIKDKNISLCENLDQGRKTCTLDYYESLYSNTIKPNNEPVYKFNFTGNKNSITTLKVNYKTWLFERSYMIKKDKILLSDSEIISLIKNYFLHNNIPTKNTRSEVHAHIDIRYVHDKNIEKLMTLLKKPESLISYYNEIYKGGIGYSVKLGYFSEDSDIFGLKVSYPRYPDFAEQDILPFIKKALTTEDIIINESEDTIRVLIPIDYSTNRNPDELIYMLQAPVYLLQLEKVSNPSGIIREIKIDPDSAACKSGITLACIEATEKNQKHYP